MEIEDACTEAYLEFELHADDNQSVEIQVLCDSYQYNSEETFLRHAKQFLIDHGGLIA